jgi:hypothetical protein
MSNNPDVSAAVQRVAEIASLLAEHRPAAKQLVKELFAKFIQVQEHYRRPQPIETAPHEAGAPIFLFCPGQEGWQVGKWSCSGAGLWVATIDNAMELRPSYWLRPAAAPEDMQPHTSDAAE